MTRNGNYRENTNSTSRNKEGLIDRKAATLQYAAPRNEKGKLHSREISESFLGCLENQGAVMDFGRGD
jgi:hypothetical protein